MTLAPALLAALLAAGDAPTVPPQPEAPKAASGRKGALRPASLPTSEGEVLEIDHRAHRLRLRTGDGELTLTFDRNTLFSDAAGATTPLRLTPGARIRVGRDGALRAAWVEVKPPPSTPRPAP